MSVSTTRRVALAATSILLLSLGFGCALDGLGQASIRAPSIDTAPTLPVGTVGEGYSTSLRASGTAPIVWSVVEGAPPAGLALDATSGVLSGTPTAEVDAKFTVQAANVLGSGRAEFTLTIGARPSITTRRLPDATLGLAYDEALAASGTAPLSWSLAVGALPDGLTLGAAMGVLTGTPTAAGQSAFTVQVTNDHGTDTQQLTLEVLPSLTPPTITEPPSPLPSATLNASYTQTFVARGSAPFVWSVSAGVLPAGLTLHATTGVLSGAPTGPGLSRFTVTATNGAGADSRVYDLPVSWLPSLSSLIPMSAPRGATVTITGSGFRTPAHVNQVFFGTAPATVLSASPTRLTVEVPKGITGDLSVRMTLGSFESNRLPFAVDPTVVRFVDRDATGGNDGASWQSAFTTLTDGLAAAQAGDEVWVAEGRYVPGTQRDATFRLAAHAPVFGGFAGEEGRREDRDPVAHATILSGDLAGDDSGFTNNGENVHHVVTAGAHTTLDGFTVEAGNANDTGSDADGGGIRVTGTGVQLDRLVLRFNHADDDGGAIHSSGGDVTCRDCVFTDNHGATAGGAVKLEAGTGDGTFLRCVFVRNFAPVAAAIATLAVGVTGRDCVFASNSAGNVGVLHLTGTSVVRGCTFFANTAAGVRAIAADATCAIVDCIFVGGSTSLPFVLVGSGGSASMTTSNIEGGLPSGVTDGGGNLDADPLFVSVTDLAGTDARFGTRDDGLMLSSGSPSIDTGTTAGASATDVTSTPRPRGAGVDMGAYER